MPRAGTTRWRTGGVRGAFVPWKAGGRRNSRPGCCCCWLVCPCWPVQPPPAAGAATCRRLWRCPRCCPAGVPAPPSDTPATPNCCRSNTEDIVEQPKLLRPPNGATLREYQIVGLQVGAGGAAFGVGWGVAVCPCSWGWSAWCWWGEAVCPRCRPAAQPAPNALHMLPRLPAQWMVSLYNNHLNGLLADEVCHCVLCVTPL